MSETLQIDITAVDSQGKPTTFSKNSGSTAACATVSSTGSIGLSTCTESITISWTFADSTGQKFRSNNPITFSPAKGNSKNSGIFGPTSLTNSDKTATIADANPDSGHRGNNNTTFSYTIHDTSADDDPQIVNRS
ncbi:MAG: hypothetical protein ACC667_05630 [Longimicrobiales bacterium]